jgi:transcriptional regulator with XRE-family HTH domain
MPLTPPQCRAARALIGWSQDQLAAASKVAKGTIANFEAGKRDPYERTLLDIQAALEAAGVEFIPANGGDAGVRLLYFVHTEQGSKRLLFLRRSASMPAGKWDGGRPIQHLPKSVHLGEEGYFIASPSGRDSELAAILWPKEKK